MMKITNFQENLCKHINRAIEYSGMTQKEIADKMEIHPTNLNQYVKGKVIPGVENVLKIAVICRVSLQWLITGDEDMILPTAGIVRDMSTTYNAKEESPWMQRLIKKLDALSPHHRAIIEELVETYYRSDGNG